MTVHSDIGFDHVSLGHNIASLSQCHLCSASQHLVTVPGHRVSALSHLTFSVAGPTVGKSVLDSLRNPALSSSRQHQMTCWRRTSSTATRHIPCSWVTLYFINVRLTLHARCGAVYCNQSCLWVCLCVGLLPWWLEIACIDPHHIGFVGKGTEHLQLIKFRPSCALRRGLRRGEIFWLCLATASV